MEINLLISKVDFETVTGWNEADYDRFNTAAIISHNIYLKEILGDTGYDNIKAVWRDEEHAELTDMIRMYLYYKTAEIMLDLSSVKSSNAGAVINNNSDANVTSDTSMHGRAFWSNLADAQCKRIQKYITKHNDVYGDMIKDSDIIKSNMYSAATCGIWLGGIRRKNVR